ncbi:MAG TPA: antibiotic biosynthesis monooxygenase [Burkholderiales bacterium]|nr:antibiotic biosynthesis monooxygenase [Burkholderiales bacterium]
MKRFCKLLGSVAVLGLVAASPAPAEVKLANGTVLPDKPFFIVTYIEAAPAEAQKAAALIKKQAAASRQQPGNIQAEALQEIGRKSHFVLLEVWQDQAAREAHAKSAGTVAFRNELQPLLHSPYDERPHAGLTAAGGGQGGRGSVYVVTHVDIIPTEQFPPCKRQVSETGPCGIGLVEKLVVDSRKHAGNLRFDALTQANRPNHMTVIEVWRSAKDQEAHTVHPDTRNFRDSLAGVAPGSGVPANPLFVINPLSGSLYDEQLYTAIE